MSALEKIQRGYDSSGRALFATKQMFQHFDRVNEAVGGVLVIVQGSFNKGTVDSAGTHDLAGCIDCRTWNLTVAQRQHAQRAGRDPDIVGGAAWWYRTPVQGFDYHLHVLLLGDAPMTPQTQFQASEYRAGRNGLANRRADDFWRPAIIRDYRYIKDPDMTPEQAATLKRIEQKLDDFRQAEAKRDKNTFERDKQRFTRLVTEMGKNADLLGRIAASAKDSETKTLAQRRQAEILKYLKEDPDVTGVDNPSDDAMAERNL